MISKGGKMTDKQLTLKVSPKGAVSIYGLRRFPITLYASEWKLIFSKKEAIESFMELNKSFLATKGRGEELTEVVV